MLHHLPCVAIEAAVMTDLSREMWYHGRISRTDAEKILDMSGGIEGNYLVRDSLTLTGEYVLSLCYQVGCSIQSSPPPPTHIVTVFHSVYVH